MGGAESCLALYTPPEGPGPSGTQSYFRIGGLNHVAFTAEDLDAAEARVKAADFVPRSHADHEPGRRFYFTDGDGIEYEVVQY